MYCTPADLYSFGLPRGGLPNPARLAHSSLASTDQIVLDEHGFYDGDAVAFRADSIDGALPSPLAEGITYYVLRVSDNAFSVAASVGGAAIDLTTNGNRVLVLAPLPIDSAIEWASALIDENLPGHIVPLSTPYPEIVRVTAAELAVGKLMSRQGAAPDTLTKAVDAAQKRLERWARGIPIRNSSVESRAGLSASATAPYRDPKGWRTEGTI